MSSLDLWIKYKENNDPKAKDDLIIKYVELVKIVAGRLFVSYNSHVEYEDLVSYGIIGLIDAIEKFDITKNIKFETYANFRIRGSIIDQLRSLDWIPRSMRQKYKSLEKVISKLQNEYGTDIKDELIANELGITVSELNKLMADISLFSLVSLDEKIEENSNFSLKSKNNETSPEGNLFDKETKNILKEKIDLLPERERTIISLYYYSELTYKEIAAILGISESRISQLHSKSIIKLRASIDELYD